MPSSLHDLDLLEAPALDDRRVSAPDVSRRGKASHREKAAFFTNLARLLRGGVPALRALDLVVGQARSTRFKTALSGVRDGVREGLDLSRALDAATGVFRPYEVAAVRAGENTGTLADCLERLAAEIRHDADLRSKALEAVTYPFFVLGTGLVTLFVILFAVVPRLGLVYRELGGRLPFSTRAILWLGDAAPAILAGFITTAAAIFWIVRRKGSSLFRRLPFISVLDAELQASRFSFLLASQLRSGVPVRDALLLAADTLPERRAAVERALAEVCQGRSLAGSLGHLGFLGPEDLALVAAGEESGSLVEALDGIASDSAARLETRARAALKILEPTLIVAIGLLVGILVVSLLLPLTQLDLLAEGS